MGPAAAGRTAERLGAAAAVVVAGIAGATTPVSPGTVVVATRLVTLDGDLLAEATSLAPKDRLEAVVAAVRAAVPKTVAGPVATGPRVVDDPRSRDVLARCEAVAIETEALGWVDACCRIGIPLVVVRAIVDTPHRRLGALADTFRPGADRASWSTVARLAANPIHWPALRRLAGDTRRAETALGAAVVAATGALSSSTRSA